MPEAVVAAVHAMAAEFDINALARGVIQGAESALCELSRMGLLADADKEAQDVRQEKA